MNLFNVGDVVVNEVNGYCEVGTVEKIWNDDSIVLYNARNGRWVADVRKCVYLYTVINARAAHNIAKEFAQDRTDNAPEPIDIADVYEKIIDTATDGGFFCQYEIDSYHPETFADVCRSLKQNGYEVIVGAGYLSIKW